METSELLTQESGSQVISCSNPAAPSQCHKSGTFFPDFRGAGPGNEAILENIVWERDN